MSAADERGSESHNIAVHIIIGSGCPGVTLAAQILRIGLLAGGQPPALFTLVPDGTVSSLAALGLPVRDVPANRIADLQLALHQHAILVVPQKVARQFGEWAASRRVTARDLPIAIITLKDGTPDGFQAACRMLSAAARLRHDGHLRVEQCFLVHSSDIGRPDLDDVEAIARALSPISFAQAEILFCPRLDVLRETFTGLAKMLKMSTQEFYDVLEAASDRCGLLFANFERVSLARAQRDLDRLRTFVEIAVANFVAAGLVPTNSRVDQGAAGRTARP